MNIRVLIVPILIGSILLSVVSCQNSIQNSTQQSLDTVEREAEDRLLARDSAVRFPQNVEILLPTQYRKESMGYPEGVKEKIWHEIYKDAKTGKWVIGQAELILTYGRDECVGEDVMIIKSENENAVLFFAGFEGFSKNMITVLEDKMLFPEHNVSFFLDGKEYQLSAVGSCLDEKGQIMTITELASKTNEELDNNIQISGYRLSLISDGRSMELAAIENMEYATPRLVWAGDLNNDGLPDLIFNLPDFYESQHVFFFLSDKNDKENPVKNIADLQVENDC